MKNLLKLLTASALFLGLGVASSHADKLEPNERQIAFMKALIEEDITAYLTGIGDDDVSAFQLINSPRAQFSFAATDITKEFASNELKAEKKYKDVLFDVTGKVAGVKRDPVNRPYVELQTDKYGVLNAMAYLTLYGADKAADYDSGQAVTLRCKGAKKVGVVALQSCQEMPPIKDQAKKAADGVVTKFLAGEDISKIITAGDEVSVPELLFNFFYLSTKFELEDACLQPKTVQSCSAIKKRTDSPSDYPDYTKTYEDSKAFYHLP